MRAQSPTCVWLLLTRQASLAREFFRQDYWSWLPFPPPEDPPNPGIESKSPVSPALWADSLPLSHLGTHVWITNVYLPIYTEKNLSSSQNTSNTTHMCFFPLTLTNSLTSAGCPTIQIRYHLPRESVRSLRLRAPSYRAASPVNLKLTSVILINQL